MMTKKRMNPNKINNKINQLKKEAEIQEKIEMQKIQPNHKQNKLKYNNKIIINKMKTTKSRMKTNKNNK